jgi:hypothetical protein
VYNNPINAHNNSNFNVPNNFTSGLNNNNHLNYPNYVPYYASRTQIPQPQSLTTPTSTQGIISNIQNATNIKAGYPSSQFTTTYNPKPYIPYYNDSNKNDKLVVGF